MKSSFLPIILWMLCYSLVSCFSDDNGYGAAEPINEELSTFEIIQQSNNHSVLENLILDSGLKQTLDEGNFTIFAPSDEAFLTTNTSDLSQAEVVNLLLNHVVQGVAESSNLTTSYLNTLATVSFSGADHNLSIHVNAGPVLTLNGVSSVTDPDNFASNGVVHVVDQIINIPDITTFALADPDLGVLVEALTRDDLNDVDFMNTLSSFEGLSPFTVFAPTNNAFTDLLSELNDVESLADIEKEKLISILNSHVISESNIISSELPTGTVETLGDSFELDGTTITDQKGRYIAISRTDVQAGNGVVHVLDAVILPDEDFNLDTTTTVVQMIVENTGSSSYLVSEIIGDEVVTDVNTENSTWNLSVGTRYELTITGASQHPFEIQDANGNVLLSQDSEGSFETDPAVDFITDGLQFEFTLTPELASEIALYICSQHSSMQGSITVS